MRPRRSTTAQTSATDRRGPEPDEAATDTGAPEAARGQANARSFGTPSAGYSTSNQVVTLDDDTRMLLTGVDIDRAGRRYGGAVPPEQATPADRADADSAAWVASRCRP